MIVTQTPIRISFLGGGTDFRQFFTQEEGWVVSSAIDRYIFVIIKQRFDRRIRVGYTRTELVDSVSELKHELVREALRKTGIDRGVEISTMGDIPAAGSGMGSSSTVTVGLLNAMYHYLGQPEGTGDAGARSLRDRDRRPRQAHRIAGPIYRSIWRPALYPFRA
jgi:D-glycero-alpha-D-manno-heptose-7-phosphate kinase